MEVSRRRMFQKHLEPARPLRRCFYIETDSLLKAELKAEPCTQDQEAAGDVYMSINVDQQKKGQISYSRDFLISLAACPQANRKPHFLADHSILSSIVRDPGDLGLHDVLKNIRKEEMWRK